MKRWTIGLLFMALVFTGPGCAQAQESPLVGKKAPDFSLERLAGGSASLSGLISGKKAIVFFFAIWCPHCREQLKALARKDQELATQSIEIVLVDIGEPAPKVARFMKAQGIDRDVLLDTGSFVAEAYGVMGVPALFFIGSDGKVLYSEFGLPDDYLQIFN